jgi:hypothetical protein
MALQHCQRDKKRVNKPCRECSRLEWELAGLRQQRGTALAEKTELQRRIYGLLADLRYKYAWHMTCAIEGN